ncbi:helix-turn-helix domain-containing protein [Candidatus Desulfosporosinus nitrosoreducens]|uniref:helix-turn-helix domain-containing protein n=1 Tax=Candidatus Desulfosporosinus nitrosoreducens TaxID=3401928 RepID=UPI0035AB8755
MPQAVRIDILGLGRNIAKRRKKRGLTQKELAKRVGISEDYLSMIEREKRRPHVKTIVRISKCLDVEIELLLRKS